MPKKTFRFFLFFVLLLAFLYFLHVLLIKKFFPEKELVLVNFSYLFNFIITFLASLLIILVRKKLQDQIAFVFLGGGIVKFVAFAVFVKVLSLDIDKSNFFDFFIPYLTCLLVEIFFCIQILKRINPNKDRQ